MKKILIVFGTRPEAIKMAPLVKGLQQDTVNFETKVCVTAQHREMLDQILDFFQIKPDFDLNIMKPNQDLTDVTCLVLSGLKGVFKKFEPDMVLVHGDTTTTLSTTLAAYYHKISVAHIEAGLRTRDIYAPFPEEINRKLTSGIADIHFAPTVSAKTNLLLEGVKENVIHVSGNTVIDALLDTYNKIKDSPDISLPFLNKDKKIILVTGHRRENFGKEFENICNALKIISQRDDVQIVYPVHLNPNIREPVSRMLKNCRNINLIEPLDYLSFVYLMNKSYIILTDSGGIQEEAPAFGKPVLVMRDTTERPEAIMAGTAILVGTNKNKIVGKCQNILDNKSAYNKMSQSINPYGNGKSAEVIINVLRRVNE